MTGPGAHAASPAPALRVLHFVSGGFSGATQVAIDLCGPQSGQDTLLVLRRRHSIDPAPRVAQLRAQGLQVEVVPRWSHWATIRALIRLCRDWRPDVLVAHGFSEHLWGRYAGLWAGVPRLIQVEHNTRERYGWWRLRQSLWLARRTERIIGVSRAVRDALVARDHPAERSWVPRAVKLGAIAQATCSPKARPASIARGLPVSIQSSISPSHQLCPLAAVYMPS